LPKDKKVKRSKHRIVCFEIDQDELNRVIKNKLGNIEVKIIVSHSNISIKTSTATGTKVKILK